MYHRDLGDLDGVLEDGWAVLLRHNNAPASAATLNVFADDHARIQVLCAANKSEVRHEPLGTLTGV